MVETAELQGGPLDGSRERVTETMRFLLAAETECAPEDVASIEATIRSGAVRRMARYNRTDRRTADGLVVFEFVGMRDIRPDDPNWAD